MGCLRIHIETDRLLIRAAEADDLPALYPVLASNPWYLALTERSGGEAGRYDLAVFQRDWPVAADVEEAKSSVKCCGPLISGGWSTAPWEFGRRNDSPWIAA